MHTLDDIISDLTPILKNHGYKKNRLTWSKSAEELTILFSIQKSQYGNDIWYYNFGIAINALLEKQTASISRCHITQRLDNTRNGKPWSADDLLNAIKIFENKYGSMHCLRTAAIENRLPLQSTRRAITYLTTHR